MKVDPTAAQKARVIACIRANDILGAIAHSKANPEIHRLFLSWLGSPRAGDPLDDALFGALGAANSRVVDAVIEALAIRPGERILEVGFGGGYGVQRAADRGARVSGLEHSEAMIERASEGDARAAFAAGNADLKRGSILDAPFPDSSFDKLYHVNCFYFWTDLDRGVAECLRVLKPGGLMLTASRAGAMDLLLGVDREYDEAKVFRNTDDGLYQAALKRAGFTDVGLDQIGAPPDDPVSRFTLIRARRP